MKSIRTAGDFRLIAHSSHQYELQGRSSTDETPPSIFMSSEELADLAYVVNQTIKDFEAESKITDKAILRELRDQIEAEVKSRDFFKGEQWKGEKT